MPAPHIAPLDDYVELANGGYTTRAMAKKFGWALARPPAEPAPPAPPVQIIGGVPKARTGLP